MTSEILPYALPLFASIGASLLIVFYAWRRKSTPGGAPLAVLSLVMVWWSFCAAASMFQNDLDTLILWANIQSFALCFLAPVWLNFVLQYTGRERWLTCRRLRLLAIEPVLFELLIWTDSYHALMRSANWLDTSGPFPMHMSTFAAGYWAHVVYSYILVSGGAILLIAKLARSYHLLYKGQLIAIVCATAVPWMANILQVLKLSPFPNIAMTPLAFTVSNIMLAWGVLRFRLLEVVPTAREVVLDSMRDGVIVLDIRGHIADLNPAAQQMIGCKAQEVIGQDAAKALPDWRDFLQIPFNEERTVSKEIQTSDMKLRSYDIRLSPLYNRRQALSGRLIVIQDTTERKLAEEERLKISKLESIGLLAGGIAHDFNNNLAAILGYITIARFEMKPEDPGAKFLDSAEEAALHARTLPQQLLTFSKGGVPIKEIVSVAALLHEAVSFSLSGSNIRCEWSLPKNLWPIVADPGQIMQVVQNLVINADQAMPDGGIITIRCANEIIEEEVTLQGVRLQTGFYVKVSISDQGVGISREHMDKIFDPYFTTKKTGTGLGLTTSFSIVKRHDGAMTVMSIPGQGTTFHLYLPASASNQPMFQERSRSDETIPHPNGNGRYQGKILIMDDEPFIRNFSSHGLTRYGYAVTSAEDGMEAIELYTHALQAGEPYDVVVMDLTIPGGMGGQETIQELLKLNADVKVIVSSGYSNDPVMANFRKYGFRACIAKPYRITDLTSVVKCVVEE